MQHPPIDRAQPLINPVLCCDPEIARKFHYVPGFQCLLQEHSDLVGGQLALVEGQQAPGVTSPPGGRELVEEGYGAHNPHSASFAAISGLGMPSSLMSTTARHRLMLFMTGHTRLSFATIPRSWQ